jgi:RNA polymerase sigma-70 factor
MENVPFDEFFQEHRQRLEQLHQSSGATRWSVSLEDFARAAWRGIAASAASRDVPQLLQHLRSEDLALAVGCLRADERAWDTFCSQCRGLLYDAARAFLSDEGRARELADSLLAELYGLQGERAERNSLFAYFHGRSSLKTWLRAVLYQKFVNDHRRESRLAPLPEEPCEPAAGKRSVSAEEDRRYAECLSEAVEAALIDLPPQEKLLLSYYYVQQLTLKQIGRLTCDHEATISRHLEAVRKKLRKRIEGHLRKVKKLSSFEIDRCLDFASRGVMVSLEKALKTE